MEARGLEPLTFCRKQCIAKQTRYRCAMPPFVEMVNIKLVYIARFNVVA